MRGHLKAQLLLAPVLVTALPTTQEVNGPHALIDLDINTTSEDIYLGGATLRLDILESTAPCGYGNVTLNGQALAQDENGVGSGPITTEHGNTILANWGFTCVHLEDEFQGQLMTFELISVDDTQVQDVGFTVQFQQMAPVSVSLINGTGSIMEAVSSEAIDDSLVKDNSAALDAELAELKSMMRQLAALEYAISTKVQHISETFDFKRPKEFHSLSECDSLKCVVKTMYSRAKHMASRLYGHGGEDEGPFGRPHWPFHHRKGHHFRPHWGPPHHGKHGNHSHPHPPHHPPHGGPPHFHPPPPFCHCPPPHPPPPEGHPPPPPHGHPPPPPPPHGHPPPPPSHHMPDDDGPEPFLGFESGPPPVNSDDEAPGQPIHILVSDEDIPPPVLIHPGRPPHHSDRPHHGRPPHHPPHHPPPPPFGPHGLLHAVSAIHIVAVVILLGLLISAVHTRCFTKSRENRRAGCVGRHREAHRQRRRKSWATRRAAISTKYGEIIQWLKENVRRQQVEDEEKEAMLRRLNGSESEEDDNLSTTMEQEIAQFRAVASVVGSLVAAEEGRSHEYPREIQQHNAPMPPSPTSAFPDYASVDEELPAYDEGMNDSRFVADGLRYTPGSSLYTSTDPSMTESSLDEHLGRKD
ncbi:hypothetical protein F4677DRAFT_12673 [Hypoxylon crocopeplum]|nr:hypothetical protein F4677DRAFT_12673 [Hypoxylon crocopeplum]